MPKSYRRNADEMLFKTDTVCQEADAKTQMLNAVCQKTHAKNQMLKKCKHDLSSNQRTEKVMKYKKTKEKGKYVTAGPSSLKEMNLKMECSLQPSSTRNTEVIIFNIRSIITKLNREIQEQWHLAPMLVYGSIHP